MGVVGYAVLIIGAVVVLVPADGLMRFAIVLLVVSAAIGLGLAIYRLRPIRTEPARAPRA